MKINKSKELNNAVKPKKNFSLIALTTIAIVIVSGGLYYGLSRVLEKESYYVLNNDIPSKTQVKESMLQEIVTSKGTAPQNAINLNQVKQGTVYTKIPLKAGDILSESNTGLNLDTTTGIPEDWVVTSFNISADDAVGGNISKGDYFDIIGVDPKEGAKYLFHNVLALDLHYNQAKTTVNEEGKVIPIGETLQYVIGMPAEDAAKLHHSFAHYEKIKLTIAPVSLKYKDRNLSNLRDPFIVDGFTEPVDLYEGTDASFTPILRDNNGRPVNESNCESGKIEPKSLCEQLPKTKEKMQRDESTKSIEQDKKENSNRKKELKKQQTTENDKSEEKQEENK